MRGAWIEIITYFKAPYVLPSHPVRGAWIEISTLADLKDLLKESHPVRGAWIEMASDKPNRVGPPGRTP